MKHLCKTFCLTYPLPILYSPAPLPSRLQGWFGLSKTEGKLKSLISENDQIDRSPISRAWYLYWVSTKCYHILTLAKDTIISEVNPQNLQFMKFYPCYSVNIVNIRKLFPIFFRERPPRNTVFWGLPPGQPACGQHELNSMLLEPFISKLSCL